MKNIFPGYYRYSEDEIKQLWATATFILDTNVLLNFYRYSEEVKTDLQKVLDKISNRLWIPYHAALEYQRNRLTVIAEQNKRFDDVRKVVRDAQSLISSIENLQLKKRHSSIDPSSFTQAIEAACTAFLKQLDQLQVKQLKVHGEDDIRNQLETILANKIGPPPTNQEYLNKLYKEGDERFKSSIPPGYTDQSKTRGEDIIDFAYGSLHYKRRFGDLILWKQILDFGKTKKPDGIIFITDDKKQDWWWEIESLGMKTIGPRPELVDEMFRETQVPFHMYTSESFMQLSQKYLSVTVRKESIDQIRDVAESNSSPSFSVDSEHLFHKAVVHWYKQAHPANYIFEIFKHDDDEFSPDVVFGRKDGTLVAFDIKLVNSWHVLIKPDFAFERNTWDENGVYNLVVAARQNVAPRQNLKHFAQHATKKISSAHGWSYDNIYVGYFMDGTFRPQWKCSKEGLEAIGESNRADE